MPKSPSGTPKIRIAEALALGGVAGRLDPGAGGRRSDIAVPDHPYAIRRTAQERAAGARQGAKLEGDQLRVIADLERASHLDQRWEADAAEGGGPSGAREQVR